MIAAELYPQEWFKTHFTNRVCPKTELFDSGHPNYWQHEIDGCSVYFVSKNEDEYGLRSVIYCVIPHDVYSLILTIQNAELPPEEQPRNDLDPRTLFTFNERLLQDNEPHYIL